MQLSLSPFTPAALHTLSPYQSLPFPDVKFRVKSDKF